MLLLLPFSFLCCCGSFKTKQNLIASSVNEVDQNQSWTTAEQFRSSLCQFVPLLGGRESLTLAALAAVRLGQTKKTVLGPILANNFTAPQTCTAEYGGSGHGPSLPLQQRP